MTDLQLVRTTLNDKYKQGFDEITADDESTKYQTTHRPIKPDSISLTVNNNPKTLDTDYTVELEEGIITFPQPPAVGELIEIIYKYSVFSDDEIEEFLEYEGSVDGAMVRCLEILWNDSARRFDYEAGQTNMKPSQVFAHIKDLLAYYRGKVGGLESAPAIADRVSTYDSDPTTDPNYNDISRRDDI